MGEWVGGMRRAGGGWGESGDCRLYSTGREWAVEVAMVDLTTNMPMVIAMPATMAKLTTTTTMVARSWSTSCMVEGLEGWLVCVRVCAVCREGRG